ncbi:hypothetical protein [Qipengyuania nanhaisediminis]|uniref:hypothetical protein n=1 Tax=Qipengyuania nanhaisediminis TaxID=604088 RepID=UPI0038B29347
MADRFAFGALGAIALAALASAPLSAQGQMNQEPDIEDIARTPLDTLNIDPDEIPPALVAAAEDPYASETLRTCNDIVGGIAAIDRVLGADFDIAEDDEGRRISEGRIAQSIVGSFIPFRGIISELSGANARKAEVNAAITAGMVRRGFLKGLGQQRGCDYPARPRADRAAASAPEAPAIED